MGASAYRNFAMSIKQKLVILDRDGVINKDSDEYIKSPEEFVAIEGSCHAIVRLKQAGYYVVIATNQSGVGRGLFDIETLNKIHLKLHNKMASMGVNIDGIFFCPHHPDDNCDCRKPKPGLFYEISQRFKIDLESAIAVGDSLRDIQAAKIAGALPVLVRTGKGAQTVRKKTGLEGVPVYRNLAAVVDDILNGKLSAA